MIKNFTKPKHRLIGHRGVAGLRPENTLLSFDYAAKIGLNWIELDARQAKCNTWIIMHDDTVNRTTNSSGEVRNKTCKELQKLDAGIWFNPRYKNEKIPTLTETILLANKLNLNLNIEIKVIKDNEQNAATSIANLLKEHYFDFEENLKPKIQSKSISVSRSTPISKSTLTSQSTPATKQTSTHKPNTILISSFSLEFLKCLRDILPEIHIGYIVHTFSDETIKIVQKFNFNVIIFNYKHSDLELIEKCHNENIFLFSYTVNNEKDGEQLLQLEIDGIVTNRPDLLNPKIANNIKKLKNDV